MRACWLTFTTFTLVALAGLAPAALAHAGEPAAAASMPALEPVPGTASGPDVVRWLLHAPDGAELQLTLAVDGETVCVLAGRIDAEVHAESFKDGLRRVDKACAILGAERGEPRPVTLRGTVELEDGQKVDVQVDATDDFDGLWDADITIEADGAASLDFPRG